MKFSAVGFLLLVIGGFVLSSCAPTMYVETGGNYTGVALQKNAPHYIVPPTPTDTPQNKTLYSDVVNAFQANHITLTQNRKDAAFLVTWGTQDQSKQVRSVEAGPNYGYPGLNINSTGVYGNPYGYTPTGPTYTTVIRSYHMQNFTISIWKNESKGSPTIALWTGSATAGVKDVKDPAPIIDDIVARYGTTFKGNTQIKASN